MNEKWMNYERSKEKNHPSRKRKKMWGVVGIAQVSLTQTHTHIKVQIQIHKKSKEMQIKTKNLFIDPALIW